MPLHLTERGHLACFDNTDSNSKLKVNLVSCKFCTQLRIIESRTHLLRGQTAMHSAATMDIDKSSARQRHVRGVKTPYPVFEPPINLDYQPAMETLLAHGADASAQDNQVITLTAKWSALHNSCGTAHGL